MAADSNFRRFRKQSRSFLLVVFSALATAALAFPAEASEIEVLHTPNDGLQPEAAVDSKGTLHVIYFSGEPRSGNLYHVTRDPGASTFSSPVRVNHRNNSAVAIGTIRGAHLALGKDDSLHVAWMGSMVTRPDPEDHHSPAPMLYTRSVDGGGSFEPERNLITHANGLDGGGSVAADREGNVHVIWHARGEDDSQGEQNRRVYVARSTDNGASFAREVPAWTQPTGVCACCGIRAFAHPATGQVYVLYRGAADSVRRDIFLLKSRADDTAFSGTHLDPWRINTCPMSSMAFAAPPAGGETTAAAWETKTRVRFLNDLSGSVRTAPESNAGRPQKHPSLAMSESGEMLLVWTEGVQWGKSGGTVRWQLYSPDGQPSLIAGSVDDLPAWSKPASAYLGGGKFVVLY